MSLAYSCILIAVLLPYVWICFAKFGRQPDGSKLRYNNHTPRLQQAQMEGRAARAVGAHQNAFEALPAFAVAVLVAVQAGVPVAQVDIAAMVFIVARVLHGVCYLADLPRARSLSWVVGLLSVIALFVMALRLA
ncbi:MAPEG family protein [Chitinimonas sp. JJ19]|uniref:MAPEG family protein n=1 Tax=Chitinimonas sp. JJ19 TaxID=3109352 RepID=UPI003001BA51